MTPLQKDAVDFTDKDRQNARQDKAPHDGGLSGCTSSFVEQETKLATAAIQYTRTNDYTNQGWVCDCLRDSWHLQIYKHVHCRVVLKQAGYPLRSFNGSRELFGGAKDALTGTIHQNKVHSVFNTACSSYFGIPEMRKNSSRCQFGKYHPISG